MKKGTVILPTHRPRYRTRPKPSCFATLTAQPPPALKLTNPHVLGSIAYALFGGQVYRGKGHAHGS